MSKSPGIAGIDAVNMRVWEEGRTAWRAGRDELHAPELRIFEKYRDRLVNKHILDIGCGTGRTTKTLLAYSKNYVGIDYSAAMVSECKALFKDAYIAQCDARDMRIFEDSRFDFTLFSYNGLDYVSHDDRLKALREIRRVLKPSGLFVFSSHNMNHHEAMVPPSLCPCLNPLTFCRRVKDFIHEMRNHTRNRKFEVSTDTYRIVSDCADGYSLLTYYIDKRLQQDQMKEQGFAVIEMYDTDGKILGIDEEDSHSSWIYYVTMKK